MTNVTLSTLGESMIRGQEFYGMKFSTRLDHNRGKTNIETTTKTRMNGSVAIVLK